MFRYCPLKPLTDEWRHWSTVVSRPHVLICSAPSFVRRTKAPGAPIFCTGIQAGAHPIHLQSRVLRFYVWSIQRTDDLRSSREGERAAGFFCIEFLATAEAAIDAFHREIRGVRSRVPNQQAQERENHKSREGMLSVAEGRCYEHVISLTM